MLRFLFLEIDIFEQKQFQTYMFSFVQQFHFEVLHRAGSPLTSSLVWMCESQYRPKNPLMKQAKVVFYNTSGTNFAFRRQNCQLFLLFEEQADGILVLSKLTYVQLFQDTVDPIFISEWTKHTQVHNIA